MVQRFSMYPASVNAAPWMWFLLKTPAVTNWFQKLRSDDQGLQAWIATESRKVSDAAETHARKLLETFRDTIRLSITEPPRTAPGWP